MLADLFVTFPELRPYLELGRAHADTLYPPAAFDDAERDRQQAALTDTRVAQPPSASPDSPRTPCSPRPGYGRTWPPDTVTASWSPSARPAR